MKFQLIDDWKRVAPKLYSVRFALVAAICAAAQAGFEYFLAGQKPWAAIAAFLFSAASAVSRVIAQPGLLDDQSDSSK